LLGAIELVDDKVNRTFLRSPGRCRYALQESLCRPRTGDARDQRYDAPFIISRSEVDEIVNLARRWFDLTARDLGKPTG
jgi:hypothetical protein